MPHTATDALEHDISAPGRSEVEFATNFYASEPKHCSQEASAKLQSSTPNDDGKGDVTTVTLSKNEDTLAPPAAIQSQKRNYEKQCDLPRPQNGSYYKKPEVANILMESESTNYAVEEILTTKHAPSNRTQLFHFWRMQKEGIPIPDKLWELWKERDPLPVLARNASQSRETLDMGKEMLAMGIPASCDESSGSDNDDDIKDSDDDSHFDYRQNDDGRNDDDDSLSDDNDDGDKDEEEEADSCNDMQKKYSNNSNPSDDRKSTEIEDSTKDMGLPAPANERYYSKPEVANILAEKENIDKAIMEIIQRNLVPIGIGKIALLALVQLRKEGKPIPDDPWLKKRQRSFDRSIHKLERPKRKYTKKKAPMEEHEETLRGLDEEQKSIINTHKLPLPCNGAFYTRPEVASVLVEAECVTFAVEGILKAKLAPTSRTQLFRFWRMKKEGKIIPDRPWGTYAKRTPKNDA